MPVGAGKTNSIRKCRDQGKGKNNAGIKSQMEEEMVIESVTPNALSAPTCRLTWRNGACMTRTSVERKAKQAIMATASVVATLTIIQRRSSMCSKNVLEASLSGKARKPKTFWSVILSSRRRKSEDRKTTPAPGAASLGHHRMGAPGGIKLVGWSFGSPAARASRFVASKRNGMALISWSFSFFPKEGISPLIPPVTI